MKFKGKILSLLIVASLVVSSMFSVGLAANYSDVDESSSYYQSISLLSALGLLKGYEDNTFKPDGDITRAEFAAVVVRAKGQEETAQSSQGDTIFEDVPGNFWGSGYINVATSLGIINGYGDGKFGPDDKVTYEQAVKMVVCALGYEPLALSKVGNDPEQVWPRGYLAAASELNIVNGVAGVEGSPAKRWQVARLVYNSLDIELMEKDALGRYIKQDKTLLSDSLAVYYSTGEFRANSFETVSQTGVRSRTGEIIIYDDTEKKEITIKDGGLNTQGLIGREIKYYYTEDTNFVKTLVYIDIRTDADDIITIDANNIEGYTGSFASGITLEYWQDKTTDTKISTAKIDKNPTVMVNGGIPEDYNEDILIPLTGSVELIDSDRNGSYDKILVTSYETYVVKSTNSSKKQVVDQYRTSAQGQVLTIDDEDPSLIVSIKRTNNTDITFSSLAKWNVLSVKKGRSGSRETIDVIVSNTVVNGTITAIEDEDRVRINDKYYEISKYYQKYAVSPDDRLEIDDSGRFYLDKDGKIAAVEKTAAASSNYAYLIGISQNFGEYKVRLFKQSDSRIGEYKATSKMRIDGEIVSQDKINALYDIINSENINVDAKAVKDEESVIPANYTPMLVRYIQNNSGEITDIKTIRSGQIELYPLTYDNKGKMKYDSQKMEFKGGTDSTFRINSTTQVFVVPFDRTDFDKYSKKTSSYFKNTQSYYIEAYDTTGSLHTASAVIVYESGAVEIDNHSPVAIIKSIKSASNPDDPDFNGKIEVYSVGFEKAFKTEPETLTARYSDVKNFSVGDVIRYELNGQGYVELIEDLYYVNTPQKVVINTKNNKDPVTGAWLALNSGLVYDVDDSDEKIITIMLADSMDPDEISGSDFDFTTKTSTKTVIYNAAKNTVESDDEFSFSALGRYGDSNQQASEVVIIQIMDDNTLKYSVVYVIER